jgi:large subunit ribosomal protein L24
MQKVIRRSALAKAQAARRLARRKERDIRITNKSKREQENYVKKEVAADIKASRLARREDWELGPLAPRRDVGLKKETYGTVSTMRLRGKELTLEERLKLNPDGGRYPTIVVGDRVVLLHGRDKGKIGKIVALDAARQEVTVEGLNMVRFLSTMCTWAHWRSNNHVELTLVVNRLM